MRAAQYPDPMNHALARAVSIFGHPMLVLPLAALVLALARGQHRTALWMGLGIRRVRRSGDGLFRAGRCAAAAGRTWMPAASSERSVAQSIPAGHCWCCRHSAAWLGACHGTRHWRWHFRRRWWRPPWLTARWCKLSLHMAFVVFAAVLLLAMRRGGWDCVALLFAVAVAWSRLRLQRHVPRDLVAGALTGALAGIAFALAARAGSGLSHGQRSAAARPTTCACSIPASIPAATGRTASRATWCWTRAIRAWPSFYPTALGWGFRRSGDLVYRPHCAGCRACVAVRIPVMRIRARPQPAALRWRAMPTSKRASCRRTHRRAPGAVPPLPVCAPSRWRHGRTRGGGVRAVPGRQLVAGPVPGTARAWPADRRRGHRHHAGCVLGGLHLLRSGAAKSAAWARWPSCGSWNGRSANRAGISTWATGSRAIAKMDYKRRFQPLESFDGRNWNRARLREASAVIAVATAWFLSSPQCIPMSESAHAPTTDCPDHAPRPRCLRARQRAWRSFRLRRGSELRVATYNTSLYSDEHGGLIRELRATARTRARSRQSSSSVRPDLVLLNEFDYDDAQLRRRPVPAQLP